jgi:hypothetical protein
MFNPTTRLPCVVGEICCVPGMAFHGNIIAPRHYIIAMINIKKGFVRLPFPNLDATKVNDMGNSIVLWQEKYLVQVF